MKYKKSFATLVAAGLVRASLAQTWCGKNFMSNQSVVPPGGQFVLPVQSVEPLLSFRCAPVFRPYLQEDAKNAAFVVDTPIVYDWIAGTEPILLPSTSASSSSSTGLGSISVTINVGSVKTTANVPLNATNFQIPIDISNLQAQKTAYNVSCSATYSSSSSSKSQQFKTGASLLYLPDTNASVTKTDLRTGALWVRPANGKGGSFAPFIPQGFYINFDEYLVTNLSFIDQLQAEGFNTLHPIPPYDNLTIFEEVINKTISAGMYIVYDMRSNYQNLTAVAEQPDGNSDPLDAAQLTYDLIYQIDGYHPVSIVLNCQDYNFSPYVNGADIVLEDAYPIGINATFSPVWHTPCTPDLVIVVATIAKSVWTTPQAFGSGAYWNTTPTGQQWAAMGFTSFSHGALVLSIPDHKRQCYDNRRDSDQPHRYYHRLRSTIHRRPEATYANYDHLGVDAGLWHNGTAYLLVVANLVDAIVYVPWEDIGLGSITNATTQLERIFSVSQNSNATGLNFLPNGIGIYIATPP
ncbi:hypothetical protein BDR07DRAFT_1610424 [Suillus spraguei]|nr:hypothetical protein BDR07DRAFT_1610424 [Suillus spraguei]